MAELRLSLAEQTNSSLAQYLNVRSESEQEFIEGHLNRALGSIASGYVRLDLPEGVIVIPLAEATENVIKRVVRIVDTQLELSETFIDEDVEPYEVLIHSVT